MHDLKPVILFLAFFSVQRYDFKTDSTLFTFSTRQLEEK